jgi:ligand-binding SRPBCC domain-containing protein
MAEIRLATFIAAPIETCFDLARSVEVHLKSTAKTNEKAIAGRTSGLCELNDEITWEATHFGVRQKLTVKITKMNRPYFFEDRMLKGAFASMRHEHHFEVKQGGTEMRDIFIFHAPFGFMGKVAERLVLENICGAFFWNGIK